MKWKNLLSTRENKVLDKKQMNEKIVNFSAFLGNPA